MNFDIMKKLSNCAFVIQDVNFYRNIYACGEKKFSVHVPLGNNNIHRGLSGNVSTSVNNGHRLHNKTSKHESMSFSHHRKFMYGTLGITLGVHGINYNEVSIYGKKFKDLTPNIKHYLDINRFSNITKAKIRQTINTGIYYGFNNKNSTDIRNVMDILLPDWEYHELLAHIENIKDTIVTPHGDQNILNTVYFFNPVEDFKQIVRNVGQALVSKKFAGGNKVDARQNRKTDQPVPDQLQTEDSVRKEFQKRLDALHDEMIETQIKHQKEIGRLDKINRELRRQIQLLKENKNVGPKRIKRNLIDMYSDLLDDLTDYDSKYNAADQLPRVVVIGDQSSGKTSVLEMIARARIFPRGSGEMMTRAPVKVTMSEGPCHVAEFRGSSREFDLTKDADLIELRKEVELRMQISVRDGKTVSSDMISMTVKGPGLQRMVLVDLPGIISTQTVGMAENTRETIKTMAKKYMSNPNAIILCIQDGSVDAERSNVTDLVAECDPEGKRTIFVLTKADLTEDNLVHPDKIKKILSGRVFPMKALGYFAVVTGRGRNDDSIQTIEKYEEEFFKKSEWFKEGLIKSSQLTTRNLSAAVANCFWKMVREPVKQQVGAFKVIRFNLEAEWKNNYPGLREQDRDELFQRARLEILDKVANLYEISPKAWEDYLLKNMWEKIKDPVFENIYLPATQGKSKGDFHTITDIKLRQWIEQSLPSVLIDCGHDTLKDEFHKCMHKTSQNASQDVFTDLKTSVVTEAMLRHSWEERILEMLHMIQIDALEDRNIMDKRDWFIAVKLLESCVKLKLKENESLTKQTTKLSKEEERKRKYVREELKKLMRLHKIYPSTLSDVDLLVASKNLQKANIEVDNAFIKENWDLIYRQHVLNQISNRLKYINQKIFYFYKWNLDVDYSDVILFHRVQQVMKATSNVLRQRIINRETRQLEKIVREVLDDYDQDNYQKQQLLTSRRVTLAEELKRVREIQDKLDEFIHVLSVKEKINQC